MGSAIILVIALLAVMFCIRKNKKDIGAIISLGSRSAGKNNGQFSFSFFLFFYASDISIYFLKVVNNGFI